MMKKFLGQLFVGLLLLVVLSSCATTGDQVIPWRKATVTSFELTVDVVTQAKEGADYLLSINAITAAQHVQVMVVYGQAKSAISTAGRLLKTAIALEDAVKREAVLAEYDSLLAQIKADLQEIYRLIKSFQKK
jgi:hypothetical protein